jgi:mevalonate kinase
VIVNTHKERITRNLVQGVYHLYQERPDHYKNIFAEIGTCARDGYQYLQEKQWQDIGKIMNKNHSLLQKIGVSCQELDEICEKSIQEGALGAKLTGAGGGGCAIFSAFATTIQ